MQPPVNLPQNGEKQIPSKPFPGSLTPGWNDPPPLNEKKSSGTKRLNLNKRVAFPLNAPINNTPPFLNDNAQLPTGTSLPIYLPNNATFSPKCDTTNQSSPESNM